MGGPLGSDIACSTPRHSTHATTPAPGDCSGASERATQQRPPPRPLVYLRVEPPRRTVRASWQRSHARLRQRMRSSEGRYDHSSIREWSSRAAPSVLAGNAAATAATPTRLLESGAAPHRAQQRPPLRPLVYLRVEPPRRTVSASWQRSHARLRQRSSEGRYDHSSIREWSSRAAPSVQAGNAAATAATPTRLLESGAAAPHRPCKLAAQPR
jgi:hypothetical protein